MRRTLSIICLFIAAAFLFGSCSEKVPEGMTPVLSVGSAQSITRYTALLSGNVAVSNDRTSVKTLRFKYGDTAEMTLSIDCNPAQKNVSATIEHLSSGTTYYYCLEAGNQYSSLQSSPQTFTTLPDSKPAISDVSILGQGPVSAILQFAIKDDGGKAIAETGFYYQIAGSNEKKSVTVSLADSIARVRLGGLVANTTYNIWPFAKNEIGETIGTQLTLKTSDVISLPKAGLLGEIIGEANKYKLATLSVSGLLNGSDLRFLRDMAGKDVNDITTSGILSELNLADAHIVAGGVSYNSSRYAAKDTIGYGLFKDCVHLKSVILPDDAKVMEENAFSGCTSLSSIQIPASMIRLTPSIGCTSLTSITVSAANNNFSSINGVLYDKAVTNLLWFPQGKDDASFTIPSSIKTLGKYAFQNCKLHAIILPSTISTLPYGVFQNSSNLTSVTLGSGTTLLSEYCFYGCPLQELHVKATVPPVANDESFAGVNASTCTLYVPSGCKSIYRNSSRYWSLFTNIIEE